MKNELTDTAETLGGLDHFLARYEEILHSRTKESLSSIAYCDKFSKEKRNPSKLRTEARQELNRLKRGIAPDLKELKAIEVLVSGMEKNYGTRLECEDKTRIENAFHKMSFHIGEMIEIVLKHGIEQKMQSAVLIEVDKFEAGKTILFNKKHYKVITSEDVEKQK